MYYCHITDHVNKLEVILQPMEDDWYLLGQQLEVEESVLADIHKSQKDVQMKCLLQKWCTEGGNLPKLENVLLGMGKKDLISGKYIACKVDDFIIVYVNKVYMNY